MSLRRILISLVLLAAPATSAAGQQWSDPSPHRDLRFSSGSLTLQYLDWGGPNRTLLLLPGLGLTPHIYDDIAPILARDFHVISLARRGHGKSDDPETGYEVDSLVGDIRNLMDHLGIDRVVLVGHSFAGLELTRFAELFPSRVSHLVYLDAAYDYTKMAAVWDQDPVNTPADSADLASFESSKRWFTRTFGFWSAAIEADARDANLQPDGTMKMESMPSRVTGALWKTMVETVPAIAAITVPTLSFFAVSDTHPSLTSIRDSATREKGNRFWAEVYRPEQRRQIAAFEAAVPRARVVLMQDTPHLCFLREGDREQIVKELRSFLESP